MSRRPRLSFALDPLSTIQTLLGAPLTTILVMLTAGILATSPAAAGPPATPDPAARVLGPGTTAEPPQIRVLEETGERLRLVFELPALAVEDLVTDAGIFQAVAIPGGDASGAPGEPMLPTFARLVSVPDRADVRVTVTSRTDGEYEGIRLVPAQPDEESGFAYDADVYTRDAFQGEVPVLVGEPAILRGVRVVPITFSPVSYNPAQSRLRVAHRMEVEVSFTGENLLNQRIGRTIPATDSFDRMYRQLIVNDGGRSGQAAGPGLWLLITPNDANVLTRLQPLIDWRKEKGYPVYVATTAETGTSAGQIKSFIQSAYNNWANPPEFIVLAGDAGGTYSIATHYEYISGYTGEGDHPYTQLDGNDLLADAHIGRLSYGTLTELETIVAKMVNYESNPYMTDTSWYTRACLVGDPYDSGYSTVQVMQWIKARLRQMSYTQIDTVFDSPFVSRMSSCLNQGDTVFAYRGIYGVSGWGNSNTYALSNGWKLPFCIVITCDTGSFASGTSRSEAFLRAGSASTPKGGVGAVGTATTGTHTRYNNCYTFGTYEGLLYRQAYEMGAAHSQGKVNLYLNYYTNQPNQATWFSHWNNLMGDPAGEVWTGVPQPLGVSHPTTVPVGSNMVAVTVTEGGQPAEGALVCLYQTAAVEVQVTGLTNAQGRAELFIPPATAGTMKLTVTKHDRLPYRTTMAVNTSEVYVGYTGSLIDDDELGESDGNGDAVINPRETIELKIQLRNFGQQAANNVTAQLSTEDPYVTIQDANDSFGLIGPGSAAWSAGNYVFSVAAGTPNGHRARFELLATTGERFWTSIIELPVVSAGLEYSTHHFTNAGGNNLPDPGETVSLSVALYNGGDVTAESPTAALISLSDFVSVIEPFRTYPFISPGGTQENTAHPYVISVDGDWPIGHLAESLVNVSYNSGAHNTTRFSIPIGVAQPEDPTGPDDYGYMAYDNTDIDYPEHPTYSWVEINPSLGGSGTQVQLGDLGEYQDKSRSVAMPFPFTYYGQTYTHATICSNGWITMGATYLTDYRNWTIPSPGGPDGVIAVFWDDLRESNTTPGHVYQFHDGVNHRWIVEWSRMRNETSSSHIETCQAIFYDPAFHPTETGDGIILFQYSSVYNYDSVDGAATIGIEKPDNSDGLLYTYFFNYTPGSATTVAGRAIRFVPKRIGTVAVEDSPEDPAFGFTADMPNPVRPGATSLRFSLERSGAVSLSVYDPAGRLLRRLLDAPLSPGTHAIAWDGCDREGHLLPAGVYFCRLEQGPRAQVRKLVVVK